MVAQGGRVSEGVHGQAHAGVGLKVPTQFLLLERLLL